VVPGSRVGPRYSVCCLCGDLVQRVPPGGVVETRRLELLTLSLQRRCSAS
jgi:hypothetical protein